MKNGCRKSSPNGNSTSIPPREADGRRRSSSASARPSSTRQARPGARPSRSLGPRLHERHRRAAGIRGERRSRLLHGAARGFQAAATREGMRLPVHPCPPNATALVRSKRSGRRTHRHASAADCTNPKLDGLSFPWPAGVSSCTFSPAVCRRCACSVEHGDNLALWGQGPVGPETNHEDH